MNLLRTYILLCRASIRCRMQYRFNFWLGTAVAALYNVAEFLMVAVVVAKFGGVKGWSVYEVGYLYAVIILAKCIYRSFANDVHNLEKYLVSGNLDQILLRPLPVLLALMTQNFRIMLGETLQGAAVLVFCMYRLGKDGQIGWIAVPETLAAIGTGAIILFAVGLATATVGFWITRLNELQNLTEDAARNAVQYPLSLYPAWLQGIFFTVLPVGFASYVPSLYILRGEYGLWILPAVFVLACGFFGLALVFWRFGLSKYQSTGT
ncbi:ABC transporter permease [Gorillibacterium massiliense]|uniref:ABC transporter permease n=1 Tax=Gorillibacterium massiliense TaxID=1280390 RepID=UPI0004B15E50|nr:ABC-2 family transporter protein [Gorillibacterium massiliense]